MALRALIQMNNFFYTDP